jgi:hypothetical protein
MAIDFCGPPKPIESTATFIIGRQDPEAVSKAVGGCVSSCLLTGSETGITCGNKGITYTPKKGELTGTCKGVLKDGKVAGPCQDAAHLSRSLTKVVIRLSDQRPHTAEDRVKYYPLVDRRKSRRKH